MNAFSRGSILPKLALLVLAFALLPADARADISKFGTETKKQRKASKEADFIPEAKAVNARFISNTSVDIELVAVTDRLGAVRFLIRELPQHGTLSAIRVNVREPHKAVVTYTHNGASNSLVDRFTYGVRMEEGGQVSAPGIVSLLGKRAEPKIEIIQPPSFAGVLPGFESTSKIILKNNGIAAFATDILWQTPWAGPPRIELGIGEQKEYVLSVKPSAPGTLMWETELQPGQPLSKMKLWVECTELFVVAPGNLKLQFDPVTGTRRGKFGIANSTGMAMKLLIEPPSRITAPKEIEVPEKRTVDVEVSMAADDVNVYRGELWVINEPYRQRVLIDAAPEPAQAMLLHPKGGALEMGVVPKGSKAEARVLLQNIGGEAAVLSAQVTPPLRLSEADSALSIGPGETREILVVALSDVPGKFDGTATFSGTGGKIAVTAKLTVTDPTAPQAIRPKAVGVSSSRVPVAIAPGSYQTVSVKAANPNDPPAAQTMAHPADQPPGPSPTGPDGKVQLNNTQKAVLDYIATWGMPTPPELLNRNLPRIEAMTLVDTARDHMTIAWKEPEEKPESYRLEYGYRIINQPTGRALKAWAEVAGMEKIKGAPGMHTVRIKNLVPDGRYELRLLSMDAEGKVSEPSDIHFFSTLPPWRLPPWTWQALVAIALALSVFVYWKLKQGAWG